jgi:hypothetical protein
MQASQGQGRNKPVCFFASPIQFRFQEKQLAKCFGMKTEVEKFVGRLCSPRSKAITLLFERAEAVNNGFKRGRIDLGIRHAHCYWICVAPDTFPAVKQTFKCGRTPT